MLFLDVEQLKKWSLKQQTVLPLLTEEVNVKLFAYVWSDRWFFNALIQKVQDIFFTMLQIIYPEI